MKKYSSNFVIQAPIKKTYDLFTSTEVMHEWKPFVRSCEIIDKSNGDFILRKIIYTFPGKNNYVIETILNTSPTYVYECQYEAGGGNIFQKNIFSSVSENETKITYEICIEETK